MLIAVAASGERLPALAQLLDQGAGSIDEVPGDDPEFAIYLRIEERELEAGG